MKITSTPHTDALDNRLRSHSPVPTRPLKTGFTKQVTDHLRKHPQKPGLRWRTDRAVQWLARSLHTSPRVAAIALAVMVPTGIGGATYVTYEWIKPSATITNITPKNDAGNRQFSVTAQCGEFMAGTLQYEVSPHSQLSDEDARKAFTNTCMFDAVQKFVSSTWSGNNGHDDLKKMKAGDIITLYQYTNMFIGDTKANPVFGLTTGTVTAINESQITIEAPIYTLETLQNGSTILETPKLTNRTLPLLKDYQVWQDGKQISRSALQIGDTVQLVNEEKHKVQYYEDIKQNALGEQISFGTIAIVKAPLELAYIMYQPFGNPVYAAALASLSPCYNNPEYICAAPYSNVAGIIYDTSGQDPKVPNNGTYLRADAADEHSVQRKGISGRITAITASSITLKTRGKVDTITVQLPYDVVGEYNKRAEAAASANTQLNATLPLAIGDLLSVYYAQAIGESPTLIKPGDITNLSLVEYQVANTVYKY